MTPMGLRRAPVNASSMLTIFTIRQGEHVIDVRVVVNVQHNLAATLVKMGHFVIFRQILSQITVIVSVWMQHLPTTKRYVGALSKMMALRVAVLPISILIKILRSASVDH